VKRWKKFEDNQTSTHWENSKKPWTFINSSNYYGKIMKNRCRRYPITLTVYMFILYRVQIRNLWDLRELTIEVWSNLPSWLLNTKSAKWLRYIHYDKNVVFLDFWLVITRQIQTTRSGDNNHYSKAWAGLSESLQNHKIPIILLEIWYFKHSI
jgi:hypothetical protein